MSKKDKNKEEKSDREKDKAKEKKEKDLDDELKQSFPASDPPSHSRPGHEEED